MQIGIFSVGDVTPDPTNGSEPTEHERIKDVARARALGPRSESLYEAVPSTYALAQIAALTTEMESRHLRRLDLELMAGR